MSITNQIAKHIRDIYFGGNWTFSNLKENLADVSWKEAITRVDNCNTIAALVFHINYFVRAVLQVLHGNPLTANDRYSFDVPLISSEDDWQKLLEQTWNEAEQFASLVEQLPDSILYETFSDEKYGNYYRNFHGIIEHSHYHLGQIVILKKVLRKNLIL